MRPAFSLLSAIVMMVIMASLLALVSNISGRLVKETTLQYREAQAALLAKSYTDFALFAIQKRDQNLTCLRTITGKTGTKNGISYQIDTKIQYIGLKVDCPETNLSVYGHYSLGNIAPSTSNDISALIDIYVQYHDSSLIDNLLSKDLNATNDTPWITYHKRTLHKIK